MLHSLTRTRHQAVEISATGWKVIRVDAGGQAVTLASGSVGQRSQWQLKLQRKPDGSTALAANGNNIVDGRAPQDTPPTIGAHRSAGRACTAVWSSIGFGVVGQPARGSLHYLYTEAFVGAGDVLVDDWRRVQARTSVMAWLRYSAIPTRGSNGMSSESNSLCGVPRPNFRQDRSPRGRPTSGRCGFAEPKTRTFRARMGRVARCPIGPMPWR